jgi:hypothetical protein
MRLNRQWLSAAAILCVVCVSALAEPKDPRSLAQKLEGFPVADIKAGKVALRDGVDIDRYIRGFVYYALPPASIQNAFKDFLKTAETARVDQQLGGNSSAGATTSTVAKAGETELLSLAFETGALTQTIDQNVATIHANGDGLYRFLSNQEVIPLCTNVEPGCRPSWAKDLDLSASFNVSGSTTKTLTGQTAGTNLPAGVSTLLDKHQFSSATVQYSAINPRDLRSKGYHDSFYKWFNTNKDALNAAGKSLLVAMYALFEPIQAEDHPGHTPYSDWRLETIGAVEAAVKTNTVEQELAAQLDKLLAAMRAKDPQFDTKLQALADAYTKYFATQDQLGRNQITAPELMIQATYSEPLLQPKLINVKFSYAWSPGTAKNTKDKPACTADLTQSTTQTCSNPGTLTINGGIDLYQKDQPTGVATNTSRFKDAQLAFQFDRPLGAGDSPAQLSLGGYYQYQRNKGVFTVPAGATSIPNTNIQLPPNGATVLTDTKGSLYVVQAVVTVQIPGSGVKVPVGISWSNKTDLVRGNEVRAHIGFNFNSVGALLSAK